MRAQTVCTVSRAKRIIAGVWAFTCVYCMLWLFLVDIQVNPDGRVQCGYRVSRDLYLPIYLIDFTIFYVDPAAPGHRSLRSHRPNPLPESSATSTKLRYHYPPPLSGGAAKNQWTPEKGVVRDAQRARFLPGNRCVCVCVCAKVNSTFLISTEIAVNGKRGAALPSCTVPYYYYLTFVFWKVSSLFLWEKCFTLLNVSFWGEECVDIFGGD